MYATLVFDTEDIYFPPQYKIDDLAGWLAEIMTEVGVRGTFFVMGEKAESLRQRGRTDVLRKMAQHDIGSHTQGNRHPLIPEALQGLGWQDGMEAMRRYENWVLDQICAAFGKEPVAFSRHNCYFGPQHVAVAGERGLPYMYMIAPIPRCVQPLWYAGAVTFPEHESSYFDGFDLIYSRDELFEKRLAELDRFLRQRLEENCPYVTIFGCHPVCVMSRGWLEHHILRTGRALSVQELGWHFGTKPGHEEDRAKANFRRLCVYLKEHPDLKVVGVQEAGRLFSAQPAQISRDALTFYAATLVEREHEIALHDTFSPAELVCGFADSLRHFGAHGSLPEEVSRRKVGGPVTRPVVAQERDVVTQAELFALAGRFLQAVESEGSLPANLETENGRVGLSQFAVLAAKAYQALARNDQYERLSVPFVTRYPEIATALEIWIHRHIREHWAMSLDFSCERMAEHARLQSWTIKPAWQCPPQGPVTYQTYGTRILLKK